MCANPVGRRSGPEEETLPAVKRIRLSPDAEVANIAATTLATSPMFVGEDLSPGRVTPPQAQSDFSGSVTITYQEHKYTYNLTKPPFASGAYNDIFTEFIHLDYPEEYVFIVSHSEAEDAAKLQTNTFNYIKSLHKEQLLPHIETPGHLIRYNDLTSGTTKTAIWTKKFNNKDLYHYFFVKKASPDMGMCYQVITGMKQLMKRRSTFLDLKAENIGVDITNGVAYLKIRDFDYVFDLPKNPEEEGVYTDVNVVSTLVDNLKHLGVEAIMRMCIPEGELKTMLTYKKELMSSLKEIKALLSTGQQVEVDDKETVSFFLERLEKSLLQIQAFQLGATLYSIMAPDHDSPYTMTDEGPDFSSPNDMSWLEEGEFKEMLLKMLDEDPKIRTDFLV